MLPNNLRIKNSAEFAQVTRSGRRITSDSLTGYLYSSDSNQPAKLGLIVGKSVGNSVVRHRISRQIRHAVKKKINSLPNGTLLVVRASKKPINAFYETENLMSKVGV